METMELVMLNCCGLCLLVGSGRTLMYEVVFFAPWLCISKAFILGVCVRGSLVIWKGMGCFSAMEESAYVG